MRVHQKGIRTVMNDKNAYENLEKRIQRIFDDDYKITRDAIFLLLFLVIAICSISITVDVDKIHKEQQEITHYLKLLYNDYEEYD